MKMVFQAILCFGLLISGILWLASQAKRDLACHPPSFIPELHQQQWDLWCWEEYRVQQTTHADEVFWVLFCTLIMTWKVS